MFPKSSWRLLLESQSCRGVSNLATDEVILRCVANGKSPPTLRLYRWYYPTLVLGRGQPVTDVDMESVVRDRIILLRRMTGGTAVLNDDVISYSVAVSDDEGRLDGTISESYRGISLALTAALSQLGVQKVQAKAMDPELVARNHANRSPVCFEIPSYYEITVDGRKLVGNSQMRIRGGILQHGSLYIDSDIGKISRYLSSHPDPKRIRSKTITLREAIGPRLSYSEVAQALVHGFREALNLELYEGSLLPWERSMIDQLIDEKYDDPAWTSRL